MQAAGSGNPNTQGSKNMDGVAETYDVFGNKVGGTSVKVHAPPGGGSSFSLGGNYYGEDSKPQAKREPNNIFGGAEEVK